MGFIRHGNYEENNIKIVIDIVKQNIRKECENIVFENRTSMESALISAMIMELRSKTNLIIEGDCYVGITANPVQSLKAHGINIYEENTFLCMDIPPENAQECKQKIKELNGFNALTNDKNDYIENSSEQLYIYIYRITDNTNEIIDTKGFVPLKKLPDKPVIVKLSYADAPESIKYYDNINKNTCDEIVSEIINGCISAKLKKFCIIHREFNRLYGEFGKECCVINYDNGTSQTGEFQSYRNGVTSRKKVKLSVNEYPEYMLCRDMSVLKNILDYFILKGRKPTKRQNIKWVNMKQKLI